MEEPGKWSKAVRSWIQELAAFLPTWFDVLFHPSRFLRKIVKNEGRRAGIGISNPMVFWTLNTLGTLVLVSGADGMIGWHDKDWGAIYQSLASPLFGVAAGTGLYWFIATLLVRHWNKRQRWTAAEVLCYASGFYLPISLLVTWTDISIGANLSRLFCRYVLGNASLASHPLISWQVKAGMCVLGLLVLCWLVFIVTGWAMVGKKPEKSLRYAAPAIIGLCIVVCVNIAFEAITGGPNALSLCQVAHSMNALDKPPVFDNLMGYQKLENLCRRIMVDGTLSTNDRYRLQKLAVIASVARDEAMRGVPSGQESCACALFQTGIEADQFDRLFASWISRKRALSEIDNRIGATSRWTDDLKSLRSLRDRPDLRTPKEGDEWGITVVKPIDSPLALWPSASKHHKRYIVWIGEKRDGKTISTEWSSDSDPWNGASSRSR